MITKAFPVYPDSDKDIEYYIRYITDPCKTLTKLGVLHLEDLFSDVEMAADFTWGAVDIGSVVDELRYICGYRCAIDSFESRCQDLKQLYLHYHRRKSDRGPIAYHIILSWPANTLISDHEVFHIGCQFLQELGPYPAVLGAHIEPCWDELKQRLTGTQKHCHMLVSAYPDDNSAPIAPSKLDLGHYSIKAREISDMLAIDHAQEIIVSADIKRNRTYNLATDDTTYVNQLITLCEDAARQAHSWPEYQAALFSKGCTLEKRGPTWIYTVSTPDGEKHIPERSLGTALSEESLCKRWLPQPEHRLDLFLSATYKSGKNAFIQIPLGGRRHKEQMCCLFPLDAATQYGVDVLKSYFSDHQFYTIVDNEEQFLCNASGSAILDYLGVNSVENSENFFSPADYQRSCPKEELCDRIDRQIARITYQINHDCEMHTEDLLLRDIYNYERWMRRGCPPPSQQWELAPYHDYCRHADGSQKTLGELLLELLLMHICPEKFDPDCYESKRYVPALSLSPNYEIQAIMDTIAIWEQEKDTWLTIEDAAHDAERQYKHAAADLAEVELALKDNTVLFSVAEYCRKTRAFLEARLRELGSVDAVKAQHPKEFAAYEAAVITAKQHAIRNWGEVMSLCAQHKHLQSLQPILLSTVAAEFERMKKLEFAKDRIQLMEIKARYHPPLSSTIDDASKRAAAQKRFPTISRKEKSRNNINQGR